jgi:dipeptidyl aminopeptidase/acylaminoacyl peptidase
VRPPRPPDTSPDAPWKQRFRASLFGGLQVAPGDRRSAVVSSNATGEFQAYALDPATGAMTQLTHADRGTVLAYLAEDGRTLLTLDDEGGNEIGHWVSIPVQGGAKTDLTPDMPGYSSWAVAVDRAGAQVAIAISTDDGTEVWIASATGDAAPRRFRAVRGVVLALAFSSNGKTLVYLSSEPTGSNTYALVASDVASGAQVGELWDGAPSSMYGLVAEPGGTKIATASNITGRARPLVWDPHSGERADLPFDLDGDVEVLDWSDDGSELLLGVSDRAEETLIRYDLGSRSGRAVDLGGGSFGEDARFGPAGDVLVVRSSALHAPEIVAVTDDGVRSLARQDAPPAAAPLRSVSFPSSDGTLIQAWVGEPDGEGPFPTILSVHGGPEGVSNDQYSARLVSWLDHGYAVCALNYRGSTTFGREYQQAIWEDIGHWETEDLAATVAWLTDQGIAERGGIVLTGGSYGGYLTLLGLGRLPGLWAGGIAIVAVGDWTLMYDETADALRAYEEQIFGGPPDEFPERYRVASPLTYVEGVDAPLFVFQGDNDSRCPPGQFRAYEDAARAAGKSIEVAWFDAGHVGPTIEQTIEQHERALGFAHGLFAEVGA